MWWYRGVIQREIVGDIGIGGGRYRICDGSIRVQEVKVLVDGDQNVKGVSWSGTR